VVNAPSALTTATAEHTFALLLALLRKIPQAFASLREGKWERTKFVGTKLEGKTIGIIGLGLLRPLPMDEFVGLDQRLYGITAYPEFEMREA